MILLVRFVAVARLGDEVICEAEAPNKREAKTKAADKALRQLEASPGPSQVRHRQTDREVRWRLVQAPARYVTDRQTDRQTDRHTGR